MRFEALICDLDGTLVDSLPGIECSARAAVQQYFPDRHLPSLRPLIGPPVRQIFASLWPDLSNEALDRVVDSFRKHYDKEGCLMTAPYPEVVHTLRMLSSLGVRLYVLTNKPMRCTETILRHIGLRDIFIDVFTPDKEGESWTVKSEGVNLLIEKHGLSPKSTLLVGDAWGDKEAALECGLGFAFAAYGYGCLEVVEKSIAGLEKEALHTFGAIMGLYEDA
jgi:phosphoglycolate phosphatase